MNNIKQEIKIFIKEHDTLLKWGLFILGLIFMLMAIQIYMKYITIIENTETIKSQNIKVQDEINYINNYQLRFLDSNHAKTFLSHENNILKEGETVIDFKGIEREKVDTEETIKENSPREEWKIYFSEKREKNTQ